MTLTQSKESAESPVLVVDDNEDMRYLIKKYVCDEIGHFCYEAETGEEAICIVKKHPEIMVAIIDLRLPGIDGAETAQKIHTRNPLIFLIALTGYANLYNLITCRRAGFDDYLIKPCELKNIRAVVSGALDIANRWRDCMGC